MQVLDEPKETIHLYVVPEDQLPPKRDYLAIFTLIFSFLILFSIIAISILAPSPNHDVSFSVHIQGFSLAPVNKTIHLTVTATGKQYVAATTATGTITFYNGAIYPQIIPLDTILKGADGISVITDKQVTIPAASQTIPPTYGRITVPAHALTPGSIGNITAGDINEACCATSVIAQNASFHGGRDAYIYTYLSDKDVQNAAAPLLPTLQSQTLSVLPIPQINPTCSTVTTSTPGVGKETTSAVVRISETCKAFSYSLKSVKDAISLYNRRFGSGKLAHVQFAIVGMKGRSITLFVTAIWEPIAVRHYYLVK
jgi:Baseplate J-like protein